MRLRSAIAWAVAFLGTWVVLAYQERTGPTHPVAGSLTTPKGQVRYLLPRSQVIRTDLPVVLPNPVPHGVEAWVRYRRYKSHDPWSVAPLRPGTFSLSRRGRVSVMDGLGARLPGLAERGGKYEYFVYVRDGETSRSITEDKPVVARFRGSVPGPALWGHVLLMFASLVLALRASLGALLGRPERTLIAATVLSLVMGAFVLGPLVQWYAFGVWWSGFPLGTDWTDNKVLVELAVWVAAWLSNRRKEAKGMVVVAGVVTLAVYLIPHSLFGSEYDYTSGVGRGTAG